jgi:Tfp pilus assembly protein PilZ
VGAEKRRYKRLRVDAMEINGVLMFAADTEIIDISIGGISLRTEKRMNIGSEYGLKIKDKARVIPLRGTVVWSLLSGTSKNADGETVPLYTAGMSFSALDSEKVEDLTRFIAGHCEEQYGQCDVHSLSGMRFNIRYSLDTGHTVLLNYPESFRVKKIGLGGMLIECTTELGVETRLPMELSLPGDMLMTFGGRVASCLPVDEEGRRIFAIGIEFIDIADNERAKLEDFISMLAEADERTSSQ